MPFEEERMQGRFTLYALRVLCIVVANRVLLIVTDASTASLRDDGCLGLLLAHDAWGLTVLTFTAMIYAIVKNVVIPAWISRENLAPLISFSCKNDN